MKAKRGKPRKPVFSSVHKSYRKLLQKVQGEIRKGRARTEYERVRTFWRIGKHIKEHILKHQERADYGRRVVENLARDLNYSRSELYRALEFARTYEIVATWRQLSWAHYKVLLSINDPKVRDRIQKRAGEGKWSLRVLLQKIREAGIRLQKGEQVRDCLLPRRGKIGEYRIVPWQNGKAYDLGFECYRWIKPRGGKSRVKVNPSQKPAVYTYKAYPERVVDGDTFWVNIHLGFDFWIHQKLRLRGIDAPEMSTPEGHAAKEYLSSRLSRPGSGEPVVITTLRSDKYDRYLVDLFVGNSYLNQELVDRGYARLAI